MKRNFAAFALTILSGLMWIPSVSADDAATAETVEITATGVGATADDAEKNALLSAVQQVVGMYVDSETQINNEQLVFDQILSVSSGFVSAYDVLRPARKRLVDGLFETTVKATVQKTKVLNSLQEAKVTTISIDGNAAWAKAYTGIEARKDGKPLLAEALSGLSVRLLQGEFVSDAGKRGEDALDPVVTVDPETGNAWCAWNIRISFDRERYYAEEVPRLRRILEAVAIRHTDHEITRITPTRFVQTRSSGNVDRGSRTSVPAGEPVRWLDNHGYNRDKRAVMESLPEIDRDRECVVFLNSSSDRTSQRHGFRAYVLPLAPYRDVINESFSAPLCRITLVGADGTTIAEELMPLDRSYLSNTKRETHKSDHRNAIEAEYIEFCNSGIALFGCARNWGTDADYPMRSDSWGDLILSPEFKTRRDIDTHDGFRDLMALADSLCIRVEFMLTPEDLKKIAKINISFSGGTRDLNY